MFLPLLSGGELAEETIVVGRGRGVLTGEVVTDGLVELVTKCATVDAHLFYPVAEK